VLSITPFIYARAIGKTEGGPWVLLAAVFLIESTKKAATTRHELQQHE